MILILKNITKLFIPHSNNLDGKLWMQKVILKKYLRKNQKNSDKYITTHICWFSSKNFPTKDLICLNILNKTYNYYI